MNIALQYKVVSAILARTAPPEAEPDSRSSGSWFIWKAITGNKRDQEKKKPKNKNMVSS